MNVYSLLMTLLLHFWRSFDSDFEQDRTPSNTQGVQFNTSIKSLPCTEEDLFNLYEICLQMNRNFRAILIYLTMDFNTRLNHKVWLHLASLKAESSLRRKLIFEKNNRIIEIDDVVRGSVIFESEDAMYQFKDRLRNYYIIHSESNNFKNNKRYKSLFLKMIDRFSEKFRGQYVLIELQLHFCGTFLVQKYTHHLYKVLRNLNILAENFYSLGELDVNSYSGHSIHPYFILIPFIQKCNDQEKQCTVPRKEVIIKENRYFFFKTLDYFRDIPYLKRYNFYQVLLRLAYKRYVSNLLIKGPEAHSIFAKTLDRILSGLFRKAFIDRRHCDSQAIERVKFHY